MVREERNVHLTVTTKKNGSIVNGYKWQLGWVGRVIGFHYIFGADVRWAKQAETALCARAADPACPIFYRQTNCFTKKRSRGDRFASVSRPKRKSDR